MTFTDDELERLKESLDNPSIHSDTKPFDVEALLSRLEAAERVCEMLPWFIDTNPTINGGNMYVYDAAHAYQQWRQEAGK